MLSLLCRHQYATYFFFVLYRFLLIVQKCLSGVIGRAKMRTATECLRRSRLITDTVVLSIQSFSTRMLLLLPTIRSKSSLIIKLKSLV